MATSTIFQPYGLGLKYTPPSLFVFYESEIGKRRRKIPLRSIQRILKSKDTTPVDLKSYESLLISNYSQHLGKVSRIQLHNILLKLLSHHNLQTTAVAAAPDSAAFIQSAVKAAADLPSLPTKTNLLDKNLNKASDEELERAKTLMEVSFEKNRVTKDSPDFEYDVKKDFGAPTMANEWDSSDDEESKGKGDTKAKLNSIPLKSTSKTTTTTTSILKKESHLSPTLSEASPAISSKEPVKHLSGLSPLPLSISKKEKQSLTDELDSLLDSFEIDEKKSKPKKLTKKVKIVSEKKGDDEKVASKEQKLMEKPVDPTLTSTDPPRTELVAPSKPLEPLSKPVSLLGGLPPLTSLSSLPPLSATKPLSLPSKTIPLSVLETVVPENSIQDDSIGKTNDAVAPFLHQSKVIPKSAFHDEIVDDISEEIVVDEDEDEDFSLLRQKLANVPNEKIGINAPSASLAPLTALVPPSAPAPLATLSALVPLAAPVPLTPPSALTSSLAPTQLSALPVKTAAISQPISSINEKIAVPLASPAKPASNQYDYEDDFEAGHTDDEIVFSDDGLSLGSADKDDLF